MWDKLLGLFVTPIAKVFTKREERKLVVKQIDGKLAEAKVNGANQITFNDQELEHILAQGTQTTWKDEYITISVVSILNIIVLGGIAAAFGETRILEGIGLSINALTSAGVDLGFILEATVLAGLGLSIWRKV